MFYNRKSKTYSFDVYEALKEVNRQVEAKIWQLARPLSSLKRRELLQSAEEKRVELLLATARENLEDPASQDYRCGFVCVKCKERFCSLLAFRIHFRNCPVEPDCQNQLYLQVKLFNPDANMGGGKDNKPLTPLIALFKPLKFKPYNR